MYDPLRFLGKYKLALFEYIGILSLDIPGKKNLHARNIEEISRNKRNKNGYDFTNRLYNK